MSTKKGTFISHKKCALKTVSNKQKSNKQNSKKSKNHKIHRCD